MTRSLLAVCHHGEHDGDQNAFADGRRVKVDVFSSFYVSLFAARFAVQRWRCLSPSRVFIFTGTEGTRSFQRSSAALKSVTGWHHNWCKNDRKLVTIEDNYSWKWPSITSCYRWHYSRVHFSYSDTEICTVDIKVDDRDKPGLMENNGIKQCNFSKYIYVIFRSILLSRPNKLGLKCPSVRQSVRPPTKTFFSISTKFGM